MIPIEQMPQSVAAQLQGIFMDIDDTLTEHGRLGADAYGALWRLKNAGLRVVPVTGRPAGWCDLIARQWPVDAVIGENGALVYFTGPTGGGLHRYYHPNAASAAQRERLSEVGKVILATVPGARLASDQDFRMFDLAVDFREDPPDLGWQAADHIRGIFEAHGACAKVSSIHVNGWFGDYTKVSMATLWAQEHWQLASGELAKHYAFCGDSPNDEPMFEFFENSCGVANVTDFADSFEHPPRYVTRSRGGAGFCEFADLLLDARGP